MYSLRWDPMNSSDREVHLLAAFVHGALAALHTLGTIYNVRKDNRWQSAVHVGGVAFSLYAVRHHIKEAVKE